MCISCEPNRPTWMFFSCEMAVNTARKAWFEVCREWFHMIFNPERKEKAYLCVCETQALLSLYFSYMGCFHQLMVFSRGHRKINKYTNMQTCIHTYTFQKTISRNQACTHSWPTVGCGHMPSLKSKIGM